MLPFVLGVLMVKRCLIIGVGRSLMVVIGLSQLFLVVFYNFMLL